jgi:hypothetical protein
MLGAEDGLLHSIFNSMTNLDIITKAVRLTLTHKPLWVLGIFLSSGFNLHAWYGMQWLSQTQLFAWAHNLWISVEPFVAWLSLLLIAGAVLVLVNFMKLLFFGYTHNQIHKVDNFECVFCRQVKDTTILKLVSSRTQLIARVVLTSLITITSTVAIISAFQFYSIHAEFSFIKSVLMIASLIVVLVGISWWNLFTVLFMMWYDLSFPKAAILSCETILIKSKRIVVITILATVIFSLVMMIGSSAILQIPLYLAFGPNFLFSEMFFNSWQILVSITTGLLLVAWIIFNNIWFNLVMVLLFNELIKPDKVLENQPKFITRQPRPVINLNHSIDKGE